MKILKYLIEAFFIYLLFLIFKLIGVKGARNISAFIFLKVGFLFRNKKLVEKNISNVFKDKSSFEIKKIIKSMWKNYGYVFAEYVHLNKFRLNKFKKKHIKILGYKKIDQIIKLKKPVVFISGHFGNFELMAMELEKSGVNLATIYRPLNNIFLDPFMVFLRKKYICKNQIKKGLKGTRDIIDFVKNKHSIALMVDQRVGESDRSPFFGIAAHTTSIPAQIAIKFNLEIVPIYLKRLDDNSFEMEILEPLQTNRTDNLEEDKKRITIQINQIIEKMINKNPDQWIWTHNRWK